MRLPTHSSGWTVLSSHFYLPPAAADSSSCSPTSGPTSFKFQPAIPPETLRTSGFSWITYAIIWWRISGRIFSLWTALCRILLSSGLWPVPNGSLQSKWNSGLDQRYRLGARRRGQVCVARGRQYPLRIHLTWRLGVNTCCLLASAVLAGFVEICLFCK